MQSPLILRSGYFKKALRASNAVELHRGFPGGSEAFEMAVLFAYGSRLPLDPFNVAALRCAAELLEMTEDHGSGNLCEAADLYLNQVVLQSWDDTLIVLQTCHTLLPVAEELLIVSRCVESLAFMACMEILDPEQKRGQPVLALRAFSGRPWDPEAIKELAGHDLWIKDLIALPFNFFVRIIRSLRRQGMKEKYVSPVVVFYANKWVLSKKTHKFWEQEDGADHAANTNDKVSSILQAIVELLPDRNAEIVPVTFYFALLSMALSLDLSDSIRVNLQHCIARLLHLARADDFLLPENRALEDEAMEEIVTIRVAFKDADNVEVVAKLWDLYLCRVAGDPKIGTDRFMQLIHTVPVADRETHDHLYKAINTYLSAHPQLCNEDKARLCSSISCQKLSQEACIQAVLDELMPLRLIIQALFVQQLHTQRALKDCSESFRYMQCGVFSGSIPSSTCHLPKSPNLDESPCDLKEATPVPLGSLIKEDQLVQRSEHTEVVEYESTRFRMQELEQELASLKFSLRSNDKSKGSLKTGLKKESFRLFDAEDRGFTRRNPFGQVSDCIGSLRWSSSQRKHASRMLKVFRRMTMLGKSKSKIKHRASASGSLACRSKSLHEMYDC
ncbi:BTB/POZ domain-containing protein At5g48130 [Curcuma longa]|uniref:BTB/POZ domain-containing protein At5g48130 n=1 Tax=Curcuma longa TaxID=136217 RepID=UPI003D9EA47A